MINSQHPTYPIESNMYFTTNKSTIHHVSNAPLFLPNAFPPIQHINPNSVTNFPVVAIIVIGMMATSLLLMAYYILVIKCCLDWNNVDLVRGRRFSFSRQNDQNQSSSYSMTSEPKGLEQEVINSIPIIRYKEEKEHGDDERVSCECAFCLNEFEQDEKLRAIPNCNHLFHIDCVDVWLQNNANCPLCRRRVSLTRETKNVENIVGDCEDFVVIDLDHENEHDDDGGQNLHERGQELVVSPRDSISSNSHKKAIKLQKVSSMKNEGIIGIKDKDDGFLVQPIRRSLSLDLSIEVCGDSSGRAKRSLFSFGHGSRSRDVVLPIHLDP
ncbi:RING-H2 finger protein ATL16-like [Vicia villosa]|uniref:RING-H2 finger protein ATL16-like n=1 Tax=Vicia villosa TaxID=3911 RepID=UPI00273AC307|nr:RING-H2 finger protein ATL16-like [Vicia villosa]